MNRPAKLVKKNAAEAVIQNPGAKLKPPSSSNPLKELNGCSPPSSRYGNVPKRGCFGSHPSGSSSSFSGSSCNGSFPRSKSLPRTPRSAPQDSRTFRSRNPVDSSQLRSGGVLLPKNPASRTRFESLRQVGASKPQKPRATDHLQRWKSGKVGSGRSFQKEKNAEAGGHGAAMAKHRDPSVRVVLGGSNVSAKGSNRESSTASIPGRRAAPPPLVPDGGLERRGVTPVTVGKISNGSIPNATPSKNGEHHQQQQLYSHTPTSTGTETPPVQASISPEILGGQSMMPTPACFAAGHLLTGVQDRRKCRPRGILNGGAGAMDMEDNQSLKSHGDHGYRCGASWTPPPMVEASMHWLSSPCDGEGGRSTGISSSISRFPMEGCAAETSVNWLLSPSEYATDECAIENFPASSSTLASNGACLSSNVFWRGFPGAIVDAAGNSPEFKGLDSLTSPHHEDTKCTVGFCCSPSNDSSISPYSMILTKAAALASCKDLSPGEDKERCCHDSLGHISPLSQGNGGGVCTPSFPSSNRQVDTMSSMGLHTMAQAVEAQNSSSSLNQSLTSGSKNYLPLSALSFQFSHTSTPSNSADSSFPSSNRQVDTTSSMGLHTMAQAVEAQNSSSSLSRSLTSGSKNYLPLSALSFQFSHTSTHSNSVDLASFQKALCHQSSVREEFPVGEKLSCSDLRVSWRGLISRIFEMNELDCCDRLPDNKENVDCHAEDQVSSKLDLKTHQNSRSSQE